MVIKSLKKSENLIKPISEYSDDGIHVKETGDILEERMDYFYLQSLEEYQEEQEDRKNRIGGWEF